MATCATTSGKLAWPCIFATLTISKMLHEQVVFNIYAQKINSMSPDNAYGRTGQSCVFPFWFEGKRYDECAALSTEYYDTAYSKFANGWCGTSSQASAGTSHF